MPVRKIGVTSRSVPSAFTSIKTGQTHMTESTLETDLLYHLEFDQFVETYEAQPVTIPYINEIGKKDKYVPDFKVVYTKRSIQEIGHGFSIIEVKEMRELEEKREHFDLKFKAAEKYCEKELGKFEIMTELDIRTTRLKSYKFLYRYLSKQSIPKIDIDIISLAKKLNPLTVQELLNNIKAANYIKLQALSNIWHLVATNGLNIDLDKPLSNSSLITVK